MSLAAILLLLAGLLVFAYYLIMFQEVGKISHFFGLLAGIWAFAGVFFVLGGVVGISYFLIFFLLLTVGYVANFLVPEEYYEDFLGKVGDFTEGMPSVSIDEDDYDKIPFVKNMKAESGLGIITVFAVILLYLVFIMTPLSPAYSDDPFQFQFDGDNDGPIGFLPYTYEKEYKNKNGATVNILSIRMIPLSKSTLDSALDKLEPTIRDSVKEKAGDDFDIEYIGEDDIDRNGHDAIQKEYEVSWEESGPFGTTHKSGRMFLEAWYCHQNLMTVVVGYFYPSESATATQQLVEEITCH